MWVERIVWIEEEVEDNVRDRGSTSGETSERPELTVNYLRVNSSFTSLL